MLKSLLDKWKGSETFISLANTLSRGTSSRISVAGLDGSARAFFTAALVHFCRKPALVITADSARAEKTCADLDAFYPGEVRLLPSRELFAPEEVLTRSEESQQMRLQFFEWLYSHKHGIYVAPQAALLSQVLPPETWQGLAIKLKPGDLLEREEFLSELTARGYERTGLTENKGHFSARGDIVDVYPPGRETPFRLELYDNRLESIKLFDPLTQRSTEKLSEAVISPARELMVTDRAFQRGRQAIERNLEHAVSRLNRRGDKDAAVSLKQYVSRHLERLAQPEGLDILSSYLPFFYNTPASLLDYLPQNFLVIIEEAAAVAEAGENLRREYEQFIGSSLVETEMLGGSSDLLWKEEELFTNLPCPLVGFSLFSGSDPVLRAKQFYSLEAKSAPSYHGQWGLLKSDLQNWTAEGYRAYILAVSARRGHSLRDLIVEDNRPEAGLNGGPEMSVPADCSILTGNLEEGFIIPELKLALLTEQNLLPGRKKKRRIRTAEGIHLSDYRDLSVGDYVVHEQHGIGRYQGLSTLEIGGVKRDYLLLKYRGTDKLYIPVDQVGLIQRYSGGEGPSPRLHSLGGGEWQRLKARVKRSVEDLARDLLSLYAARQAVQGYRFGPDHPWQQEFEANFPYEETPDQLRAVAEVKADLERSHPMDRLLCGDVGYGKTEVAMRAAFKVIMEGKQVAVLVPTTVLAQQHFRTFQERFNGFPIRVAQLSRFVPAAKQKEVIREIAAGKIDIIIGTHRLLSRDVAFHDLGLLVIDEEQRFGVRQKEKMKKMRLEVDTLAMTATPIPRTLHLSLSGARDLSIIDTPPEDRYPIQTYVLEYSESMVREAVQRELSRQGQVFIVFNRVDRIDAFTGKIKKLFPGAKVAVGHGQMPEAVLERVMAEFQAGRYEILVSTTIIESGLDIPNVNTLIVCEADKFGLAQLYQIRGRVGRSNRLAYAYLTYRKDKVVSETARKRLRAIKEFTELGSGFKIALQDLEIRGAGNILGAEQHGFIAAVGFDLYTRLLNRAVAELKNEKREEVFNPRLELQISAYLPSGYITVQAQKVDFYQRLYRISTFEELQEIKEELSDRFGTPPEPVVNLLAVAELRVLAIKLSIELIRQDDFILIRFRPGAQLSGSELQNLEHHSGSKIKIAGLDPLTAKISMEKKTAHLLPALNALLNELLSMQPSSAGGCKVT